MQIINFWDIQVWDGGDRHFHKHYVSTKAAADAWMSKNPYDLIQEVELVIFDDMDELQDHANGEVRKRALAKLTAEEKIALGLKD
jgi:hypothetical protein